MTTFKKLPRQTPSMPMITPENTIEIEADSWKYDGLKTHPWENNRMASICIWKYAGTYCLFNPAFFRGFGRPDLPARH